MADALQPNQVVAVSLEAQQWNVVVGQLMEGPYKVMAPLIGSIIAQCSQAIPPTATQPDMQKGPRLVVADGPPPGYQQQQQSEPTDTGGEHGTNNVGAEESPAA